MRRAWPLVPILLLAGCGGGGTGDRTFFEATTGSAAISFAPGTGYNGSVATFSALTGLTGSATGRVVTIEATANERAVEIVLVAPNANTGAVVDLAGTSGSSVEYTDSAALGKYRAVSGKITVTTRSANSVTLTLADVVVNTENKSATGGGQGSVTLSGPISIAGAS